MKLTLIMLGLLALTGCSAPSDAPTRTGVCWLQALNGPGAGAPRKPHFGVLSVGDPNLETCAVHLELTGISKHRRDLLGAYQGQYVFVTQETISSSESLTGQRFSLFTPGQRADIDAQIGDLLKAPAKTSGPKAKTPSPVRAAAPAS